MEQGEVERMRFLGMYISMVECRKDKKYTKAKKKENTRIWVWWDNRGSVSKPTVTQHAAESSIPCTENFCVPLGKMNRVRRAVVLIEKKKSSTALRKTTGHGKAV